MHTFLPLTVTAPCTTNCRACRVLLANIARKMATSSRRSRGAKVICVKGVKDVWSLAPSPSASDSRPAPRPADIAEPSSLANFSGLMGTTLRMRRVNIRDH